MLYKMFGKKLSSRLIVIMSLTMLTVYLIVGLTISSYMLDRQVVYLQSETNLKARTIAKDISSNFTTTKVIVQQMTYNQQIRTYLREVSTRDQIKGHPLYSDVFTTLKLIANSNSLFNIAWVANDKASFYTENTGFVTDEKYIITKRPWHQGAVEAKDVVFSKPYVDYGTKKTIISCITPIREKNKIIGFCAIDMVISSIPEYMKAYKIGAGGQNFLLTSDGTFIYNEDQSKIMNQSIFNDRTGLELSAKEIMTHDQGFKEILFNGQPYYLSYRNIQENGWVVGTLINKEEALKGFKQASMQIYLMLVASALVILLAIYLVVSKMTKPFSEVTNHARVISEGDFSRNLPEKYLLRVDEMGELSKAVQLITHAFRSENELLEKKIEEKNLELQEQYRYISESERISALGILVAGVAHELNTPLGVSMTSATYLQKINREILDKVNQGTVTKGQFTEFMENVSSSVDLLNNNISRVAELISNFKQVAVDQNTERIVQFNMREYIQLVSDSISKEDLNLNLVVDIQCAEDLIVESYPGVFSQIFTNLLLNSIKHGFKNREKGRVIVSCRYAGPILQVEYSDDGSGIQQEHLKKIFDPFFTTDHEGGSSGLGMHIVYNLVTQKLKGVIHLESELGKGVRILIEVPTTK